MESMAVVMRANKRMLDQGFDPGAMMPRRAYDIYSDIS